MAKLEFPGDFVWGAATSAYQIEGASTADGRGESIWDRFCKGQGNILDSSSGATACDHYNLFRNDVALMRELGVQAYRFSLAWPRVLPQGRGTVNQKGLDFYDRLVDELLNAGITPFATLFHWDLPQVLQEEGGWPVRSTAEAFVEYTEAVTRRLGDRVRNWITHNEPWCAGLLSYQLGLHAPGVKDWSAGLAASHHLLLSHGWAVPVIRHHSPGAQVGITLNFTVGVPASPSDADRDACRHFDGYFNRWFLDPVYGRGYPADMIADYADLGYLPKGGPDWQKAGDLEAIAVPTDFLGVNYYTRKVVRSETVPENRNLPRTVFPAPAEDRTEMGWEVYPDGLYHLITRIQDEYNPPKMYITENGASYGDGPDGQGKIDDQRRVRFLYDHLLRIRNAAAEGVRVAGYFVWSFLDNFEWEKGYTQRFGIVWVDYKTQIRLPKRSAYWYADVIAANALNGDGSRPHAEAAEERRALATEEP